MAAAESESDRTVKRGDISSTHKMPSRNCEEVQDAPTPVERSADETAGRLGIEIVGVRLSAAGYLLTFQYRILDSEKVLPWVDANAKAFLLDQATGDKFYVPSTAKIGALRQTTRNPLVGRTYFIMFKNTGRAVTAGKMVTVAVGDYELRDLTVE